MDDFVIRSSSKNPVFTRAIAVAAIVTAFIVLAGALPADADAKRSDRTRVIVKLAVVEADASPATIAQVADALIASLPANDFTVVNRPYVLPYLTLSAGPSALSVLQSSGLVALVERDGTVSAASGKGKRTKGGSKRRRCKTLRLGDGTVLRMCKKDTKQRRTKRNRKRRAA